MAEGPKKGRLTLYEDLLSAETRAQMAAKDAATQAEEAKKKSNASLMFKPTNLGKKPTNTTKSKPSFASMHKLPANTTTSTVISAPPVTYTTASLPEAQNQQPPSAPVQPPDQQQGKQGQKRGFNDWLADEDEEWQYYERPKYERGGKKKKKKNNKQAQEELWSWEDIYDPTVPVPFLKYPKSDPQYDVNDAWKRRLYAAHRRVMRRQGKTGPGNEDRPSKNRSAPNSNFAPPGNLNFAPPAEYSSDGMSRPHSSGRSSSRRNSDGPVYTPAELPTDETGDDAFARRLAMSQVPSLPATAVAPPPSVRPGQAPPAAGVTPPPPPPPPRKPLTVDAAEKAAKAAAQIAALKAKIAASKPNQSNESPGSGRVETQSPVKETVAVSQQPPPDAKPSSPTPSGTISAAPTFNPEYYTRNEQPTASESDAAASVLEDSEEVRSNRPGQAGFAERMLKKMGWEKGQGLGKTGDGITTAIFAKAEKRKKLPDSAGGGFAAPANMGKIVGGHKKKRTPGEEAKDGDGVLGNMSEVIKLEGMLKGLDVDLEIQDNNLLQEIGDELGQYGTVERLFIWREHLGGTNDVFVKFTSQLSALRAVKAMDGEEFAENVISAKFWDSEKFANEEYS